MSARPMSAAGYTPVQHPAHGLACPDSLMLTASDLGLEDLHQSTRAQGRPLPGPGQRGLQELSPISLSQVNHGEGIELSSYTLKDTK